MKRSRFKETEIVSILKQVEGGRNVRDVCREYGISETIDIDLNLPAQRIIRVMDRVAAWRGYPAKIRMDNGPELTSVKMADWAEEHGVELEFIQPGKPMQNSYIERFNRTYREEVLDLYVFRKLSEVREITDNWLIDYNEERPHDSLGKLTPVEYAEANKGLENSNLAWH